jgi:hypothetical protein
MKLRNDGAIAIENVTGAHGNQVTLIWPIHDQAHGEAT